MITTLIAIPMTILVTSVDAVISGQKMEKEMSNLNYTCKKNIEIYMKFKSRDTIMVQRPIKKT